MLKNNGLPLPPVAVKLTDPVPFSVNDWEGELELKAMNVGAALMEPPLGLHPSWPIFTVTLALYGTALTTAETVPVT
jgi:hypothetical protein